MIKRIAIIGYGMRGQIYSEYTKVFPEQFELVAVVDSDEKKLERAKAEHGVSHLFKDYKSFLKSKLTADIVAICTQDDTHCEIASECMYSGYDLLLEKPVSNKESDVREVYRVAKVTGRRIIVTHVLRYSPFYSKIKEIVDSGVIGEVVNITTSENVSYYHASHSFVRGPWRNKEQSSPMILAKCCHDMDLFNFFMGEKCIAVSSFGGLYYYNEKNKPLLSADYCSDCGVKDCEYRAQEMYLNPNYRWMANYFAKPTDDNQTVLKKLEKSQYDKCVFKTDNNVVDHQVVICQYSNGKTATHTMVDFSKEIYRDIKINGTKGEISGIMENGYFEVRLFKGETLKYNIDIFSAPVGGHGGSDCALMQALYKVLNGEKAKGQTSIDVSIESHIMAFAAEESRLHGGVPVKIEL